MTADQAPPVWAEFAETAGDFFREDPIKTIRWIAAAVARPGPRDPILVPYLVRLEADGCPTGSPLSALRYLEERPGTAEEFASWAMTLPPVIRVTLADDLSQAFYCWDNMEGGAPYWLTEAEADNPGTQEEINQALIDRNIAGQNLIALLAEHAESGRRVAAQYAAYVDLNRRVKEMITEMKETT